MRLHAVRTAIPLATASLLLTGIGLAAPSVANTPTTTEGDLVRNSLLSATDEQLPVGAWARVMAIETGSGKTVVTLQVRGLAVNATYGAHAHYRPCGLASQPLASGAHYQNVPQYADETTASKNVAYANPANEVWLDLTTDDEGNGSAQTVVNWQFRGSDPVLRSVVIHRDFTNPADGSAGVAGPRLGCLSVAF